MIGNAIAEGSLEWGFIIFEVREKTAQANTNGRNGVADESAAGGLKATSEVRTWRFGRFYVKPRKACFMT
jgi:hypothetical protein